MEILEELRRAGQLNSKGFFTLDPRLAREKLRGYLLADPFRYSVHIVSGLACAGASRIQVDSRGSVIRFTADGPGFSREELSHLFSSLFVTQRTRELVTLQELAIGVNAALSLEPRHVDLETPGLRLRITAKGESLQDLPGRASAVTLLVEHNLKRKFARFFRSGEQPELQVLRDAFPFRRFSLTVNGTELPRLDPRPPQVWIRSELAEPLRGELSLADQPGRLLWLVNGQHYWEDWPTPGLALVEADLLPRDLSQNSLKSCEEKSRLRLVLEAEARRLKAALAHQQPTDERLRTLLWGWLAEDGSLIQEAMEAPLFPVAWPGPSVTYLDVTRAVGRWGACLVSTQEWPTGPMDGTPVLRCEEVHQPLLRGLFGRLSSGDWLLQEAIQAEANRLEFESRPPTGLALEPDTLQIRPFAEEGWQGVLGIGDRDSLGTDVTYLRGGRRLGWRRYSCEEGWPAMAVARMDHPETPPNPVWNGVASDHPLLLEAEHVLRRQIRTALETAPPPASPRERLFLLSGLACVQSKGLTHLPLFPLLDGSWASFEQLRSQYLRLHHLPTCERSSQVPLPDLVMHWKQPWRTFAARLFENVQDYESKLKAVEKSEQARQRWLQQPRELPALSARQPWLARVPLVGLLGELGIPAVAPSLTTRIYCYREGRSLGTRVEVMELRLAALPPGLAAAVEHPDFLPDSTYTGVQEGAAWAEVHGVVRATLPDLVRALAADFPADGELRRWAQCFLATCLPYLSELPPELRQCPCWDGIDGVPLTPEQISTEPLRYVLDSRVPEPVQDLPPTLWVTPQLYERLQAWLGMERLANCEEEYLARLCQADYLRREAEEAVLPGRPLTRLSLESLHWHGEIGLSRRSQTPPLGLDVRVLREGRHLCDWQLSLGEPEASHGRLRLQAVVDCPGLTPNREWTDAERSPLLDLLRQSLLEEARRVGLDLEPRDEDELGFLWTRVGWEKSQPDSEARTRWLERPLFAGRDCLYSYAQLSGEGRVGFCLGSWEEAEELDSPVVFLKRELLPLFRSLFRTYDATHQLQSRSRRQVHQRAQEARLDLPEGTYLVRWRVGAGEVGLLPEVGRTSLIHLHRQRRLLETVQRDWDFTLLAFLEEDRLRPNREWTGAERDEVFETLLESLRQDALERLREVDPTYQLRLAVSPAGEPFQALPLMHDPFAQSLSLADLDRAYGKERLLYWPEGSPAPSGPEVFPEGLPVPVLDRARRLILETRYGTAVDYRASAAWAEELLAQPAVPFPTPAADDSLLTVPLECGWLQSSLASEVRLVEVHWRGRRVHQQRSLGWPGVSAALSSDGLIFRGRGLHPQWEKLLEPALRRLEEQWLTRLDTHPLPDVPDRPRRGRLADRLAELQKQAGREAERWLEPIRLFFASWGRPVVVELDEGVTDCHVSWTAEALSIRVNPRHAWAEQARQQPWWAALRIAQRIPLEARLRHQHILASLRRLRT